MNKINKEVKIFFARMQELQKKEVEKYISNPMNAWTRWIPLLDFRAYYESKTKSMSGNYEIRIVGNEKAENCGSGNIWSRIDEFYKQMKTGGEVYQKTKSILENGIWKKKVTSQKNYPGARRAYEKDPDVWNYEIRYLEYPKFLCEVKETKQQILNETTNRINKKIARDYNLYDNKLHLFNIIKN